MKRRRITQSLLLSLALVLMINSQASSNEQIRIVCSFSDYASIASMIAGDKAIIEMISNGEQDPHFIPPKPSYAMMLNKADMWITTGMDLEQWS